MKKKGEKDMEEKKTIKISLSTLFLIIAIIVIIVMGIFCYSMYNKKIEVEEQMNIFNSKVNNIETNSQEPSNNSNISATNNINSSNQEDNLTEEEAQEIFEKVTENKAFIQEMVTIKDFSSSSFTDEEILKLLPLLDDSGYFTIENNYDGNFAKANISDIQNLAQKYFEKNIDINKISEKIENNSISVEVESGYGIVNYELVSVSKKDDNEYSIKFKYIDENTYIYTITVKDTDSNIVYISLEK